MKQKENIIIGISIGDLNGIGGEIILKTFHDSRILEFCTPVIFASVKTLHTLKDHFKYKINYHGIHDFKQLIHGKINVFNCWKEPFKIAFGKESKEAGEYAIKSLKQSVNALKKGNIQALVTAPIHKNNIQSEDFNFPGHTDFLAKELDGESLMFMITDSLKVGLLTDHVPVKDVSKHITPNLIKKKIDLISQSLIRDFKIQKPKIAVLGINPHAGDSGVIGEEDDTIFKPTIQEIKNQGKLVFGPYAADSFFGSDNYKNFDAIIAAYHDQGLIPFKTLSFGEGVNFTAGLSSVRTSPDHGTAFEIAGKGIANENSFREALFKAIEIYNNRSEYNDLTSNPLKVKRK